MAASYNSSNLFILLFNTLNFSRLLFGLHYVLLLTSTLRFEAGESGVCFFAKHCASHAPVVHTTKQLLPLSQVRLIPKGRPEIPAELQRRRTRFEHWKWSQRDKRPSSICCFHGKCQLSLEQDRRTSDADKATAGCTSQRPGGMTSVVPLDGFHLVRADTIIR